MSNSPGFQAKGVLDPVHHHSHTDYCLWAYPFIPMVDIWGINLKGRKVSLAHPDHSYGCGVLTFIDPIGGLLATSLLITVEFQQWEP